MASAGTLWINIAARTDKLTKGLRSARAQLNKFGPSLKIAAIAGAGVVAASIKVASDAAESINRFNAVYGKQAKDAEKFASGLAKTIGRSRVEIMDSLSSFQSFFVGLGFGAEKSAGLSSQLQSLALDFASFNNLSDSEAMGRFISALSGSSEVLDRFGINIKQAALQQELLRQGVRKSWTEVTEQEKAIARLNIIMKAMGDQGAVGDAAKTAGSFANRLKALQASIKDVGVDLGTILLPSATLAVSMMRDAVEETRKWTGANEALASGMGLFGDVIQSIQIYWKGLEVLVLKTLDVLLAAVETVTIKLFALINKLPGGSKERQLRASLMVAKESSGRKNAIAEAIQELDALLVGPSASEKVDKFFREVKRKAEEAANAVGQSVQKFVLPPDEEELFRKLGGGMASVAGFLAGSFKSGIQSAARAVSSRDIGMPPALQLTQAGTAESYRQRAAISRQEETSKVAKNHLKEAKKHTSLLEQIKAGIGSVVPSNIFG